jgi:hypothetical protein
VALVPPLSLMTYPPLPLLITRAMPVCPLASAETSGTPRAVPVTTPAW